MSAKALLLYRNATPCSAQVPHLALTQRLT